MVKSEKYQYLFFYKKTGAFPLPRSVKTIIFILASYIHLAWPMPKVSKGRLYRRCLWQMKAVYALDNGKPFGIIVLFP